MRLWIVGTFHGNYGSFKDRIVAWTYEGAFSSKELALARAHRLGRANVFIAPTELDIELPDQGVDWPDVEYPNAAVGS